MLYFRLVCICVYYNKFRQGLLEIVFRMQWFVYPLVNSNIIIPSNNIPYQPVYTTMLPNPWPDRSENYLFDIYILFFIQRTPKKWTSLRQPRKTAEESVTEIESSPQSQRRTNWAVYQHFSTASDSPTPLLVSLFYDLILYV